MNWFEIGQSAVIIFLGFALYIRSENLQRDIDRVYKITISLYHTKQDKSR